jgi:hypothetical protein
MSTCCIRPPFTTFFLLLFRGGLYHIVNSGEDVQGGNIGTSLSSRGVIQHTRSSVKRYVILVFTEQGSYHRNMGC